MTLVAPPEPSHRIAILVVPLAPSSGKPARLIPAGAEVPWFRDELDPGENRILLQGGHELSGHVDAGIIACQNRRNVKAKPVYMHLRDPVTQTIQHQLAGSAVMHVYRVAAAG